MKYICINKNREIMKRNVKTLSVYIGEEKVLSLIKNTPALRSYFRDADKLIVGENLINVNHYDFSQLINSQLYGKAIVKEIN